VKKLIPQDSLFREQKIQPPTNEQITKRVKGEPGPLPRTLPQTTQPELVFNKGSIISQESDTLKFQKFPITEIKKGATGTLLIDVQTNEPYFIIQLTSPDGEIVEEIKNLNKYTFQYLQPKNYKIKVILDKNNNGKWDPGNFYNREEPEPIWFYQTQDKKYDFPIRANWELGPLLLIF